MRVSDIPEVEGAAAVAHEVVAVANPVVVLLLEAATALDTNHPLVAFPTDWGS